MRNDLLPAPENQQAGYDNNFQERLAREKMDSGEAGNDLGETENNAKEETGSSKNLSDKALGAAEAAGVGAGAAEAAGAALGPEAEVASRFAFKGGRKKLSVKSLAKNKGLLAGGAGGGGIIIVLVFLFLLAGQLKVISFGQVLTTTTYARFGNMLKERWTNDFLDRAVVEGEGSVNGKSTFFDNFRLKNPNTRITELGREGKLKYEFKNGRIDTFKVGEGSVSLDGIVKDLGLGDSYEAINPKGLSRYTPKNIEARAAAKKLFVDEANKLKSSEVLAEESGVVRSRAFGYLADQTGFKFSRWRQKGREFLGKGVLESQENDTANNVSEIAPEDPLPSGIDPVDKFLKDSKNPDNIKKLVKENAGNPDIQNRIMDSFSADLAKATKIQEGAATAGQITLAASIACMINVAARNTEKARERNYQHAMDFSLRLSAASHQAQNGEVTSEVYGVEATNLDGAESSPAYQYKTGITNIETPPGFDKPKINTGLSPKIISIAKAATNPVGGVVGILSGITGIGAGVIDRINADLCGALLSPQGALVALSAELITQVVVAVFSGGAGTAASEGGAIAFSRVLVQGLFTGIKETAFGLVKSLPTLVGVGLFGLGLELLSRYLSQSDFTGLSKGADRFEQASTGGQLVQDNQFRTMMGGAPIPNDEVNALDQDAQVVVRDSYKNDSFFARMFSPKNPYSLGTAAIIRTPSSFNGAATMVRHWQISLGSIFTNPVRSFGSIFMSKAGAQAANNYRPHQDDYQAWGWTQDELDLISTDDSYGLVGNLTWFDDHDINPATDDMFSKYAPCFDPQTTQYKANNDEELLDECTNHEDLGDEVALRYRVYLMDKFITEQQDQKFSNSPHDLNGGGAAGTPGPAATPTTPGATNPPVTGASGDAKQLAATILANPKISLSGRLVRSDVVAASQGTNASAGAPVSSAILKYLATIGESHTVSVSAIESGGSGHSSTSYHYTGDGIDFNYIDGVHSSGRGPGDVALILIGNQVLPPGSAYGQSNCGATPPLPPTFKTFGDTCSHLHVQVPRGTP